MADRDGRSRLQRIFENAVRLPEEKRASFLAEACGDDDAIKAQIERLLAAHAAADSFLATDASETPQRVAAAADAGPTLPVERGTVAPEPDSTGGEIEASADFDPSRSSRIGPYKLLQKLGEGGFGSVWMAEQEAPVRRRVAVKVIKLGMDTREVIARFEAERQALAMMEHPNIARVLDAGSTREGRPYFVMELVRGVAISEYCDANNLSPRERLELFIPVCDAVQHAHQKGIIHRDLKPSNVLVTVNDGRAVPKIIDFGIAKATHQKLTEKTFFTRFHAMVGTPAYMSPEQAEMSSLDIDTRSDIYSLGVLLYELLTGTTPFDTKELFERGYKEVQRVIREETPPKPSTRVSSMDDESRTVVAGSRQVDARELGRLLRGDLDWIIMKALEKDRSRRYESAAAFALDIGRFLEHEPVAAGPPSTAYRVKKFIRRNRVAVAGAGVVAGALITGLLLAIWGFIVAADERDLAQTAATTAQEAEGRERAEKENARIAQAKAEESAKIARREADTARRVFGLIDEMFHAADPETARGPTYTVRQLLDDYTRADLWDALRDEPEIEATLRHTVGRAHLGLGRFKLAEASFERSIEVRSARLGDDALPTILAREGLGETYSEMARFRDAESTFRDLRAVCERVLGEDDLTTLRMTVHLAEVSARLGRLKEAESLLMETRDLAALLGGEDHDVTLSAIATLGAVLGAAGRFVASEKVTSEVIPRLRKELGAEHPKVLTASFDRARALHYSGRIDESEKLSRETLAACRRVLGPEHAKTLRGMHDLAAVLPLLERHDEAIALFEEVIEIGTRVYGGDFPPVARARMNVGVIHSQQARYEKAKDNLRRALAAYEKIYGADHSQTAEVHAALGVTFTYEGNHSEGAEWSGKALEIRKRTLGPEHARTLESMTNLAANYTALGRAEEAKALLEETIDDLKEAVGAENPSILVVLLNLGEAYVRTGECDRAETVLKELFDLQERIGTTRAGIARAHAAMATCLESEARFEAALPHIERVVEIIRAAARPEQMPRNASALLMYGLVLVGNEKHVKAEKILQECLGYLRQNADENAIQIWAAESALGDSLLGQGRLKEARTLLIESYRNMKDDPRTLERTLRLTLDRLVRLYQAAGDEKRERAWKKRFEEFERERASTTESR